MRHSCRVIARVATHCTHALGLGNMVEPLYNADTLGTTKTVVITEVS